MKKILLFVVALCLIPAARAVEELDEKMPVTDWNANYAPVKTEANNAMEAGDFVNAADLFVEAGEAHAFAWVRARMFANGALCYLRQAQTTGSAAEQKRAANAGLELLDKAMALYDKAELVDENGCVHPTGHADASAALGRHLKQIAGLLAKLL